LNLESNEAEATMAEQETNALSVPYYSVIAGSFRSMENATQKIAALKKEGYEAELTERNPSGLFRVAYGRFTSKREALSLHDYIIYALEQEAWYLEEK